MLLAFSIETIVPIALFGLFAAVAWWVLEYFTADKSRTEERLEELKDPTLRRRNQEITSKKADAVSRVLEKASQAAKPLAPKNEFEANKVKAKLANAGFRGDAHASAFLGLKFVLMSVGFVLAGGTTLFTMG